MGTIELDFIYSSLVREKFSSNNCSIFLDALAVVKVIIADEDQIIMFITQEIVALLRSFFVSFNISRNLNEDARNLAKFSFDGGDDFEWIDRFSGWLTGHFFCFLSKVFLSTIEK